MLLYVFAFFSSPIPSRALIHMIYWGGKNKFIVVYIKKGHEGYDCYNSFINSKECHNGTVNLLPTSVYIHNYYQSAHFQPSLFFILWSLNYKKTIL